MTSSQSRHGVIRGSVWRAQIRVETTSDVIWVGAKREKGAIMSVRLANETTLGMSIRLVNGHFRTSVFNQ